MSLIEEITAVLNHVHGCEFLVFKMCGISDHVFTTYACVMCCTVDYPISATRSLAVLIGSLPNNWFNRC